MSLVFPRSAFYFFLPTKQKPSFSSSLTCVAQTCMLKQKIMHVSSLALMSPVNPGWLRGSSVRVTCCLTAQTPTLQSFPSQSQWSVLLFVVSLRKKKGTIMEGVWLNFPVYAWTWISSSIFSESRDGFAISCSKSWSVFATLHWLLLISPVNFCTSQSKEEFYEGISQRPPTHWKQSCSPYPLRNSLKIILVIPFKEFLSKAFLMAHVRARLFLRGEFNQKSILSWLTSAKRN